VQKENKVLKFTDLEVDESRYTIQELIMYENHINHNFYPPLDNRLTKYLLGMMKKINAKELDGTEEVIINNETGETKCVYELMEMFHLTQMIDERINYPIDEDDE